MYVLCLASICLLHLVNFVACAYKINPMLACYDQLLILLCIKLQRALQCFRASQNFTTTYSIDTPVASLCQLTDHT